MMLGEKKLMSNKIKIAKIPPRRSFELKNDLNSILSRGGLVLDGFEDPFSWRKIKWSSTKRDRTKGKRK